MIRSKCFENDFFVAFFCLTFLCARCFVLDIFFLLCDLEYELVELWTPVVECLVRALSPNKTRIQCDTRNRMRQKKSRKKRHKKGMQNYLTQQTRDRKPRVGDLMESHSMQFRSMCITHRSCAYRIASETITLHVVTQSLKNRRDERIDNIFSFFFCHC